MSVFQAVANNNSTIGYAHYGRTAWFVGSDNGACQGAYETTQAARSRVGVMVFTGAGAALRDKTITQIALTFTCTSAGSDSSNKVLTLCRANYQVLQTETTGSAYVGAALGTLTGKFFNNITTHILSASSNSALFQAMVSYLNEGNSALVIYNGEVSLSGAGAYSANYTRISSCTLTVTYEDATVWHCIDGVWKKCTVWCYINNGWVHCVPYYNNLGTWIKV